MSYGYRDIVDYPASEALYFTTTCFVFPFLITLSIFWGGRIKRCIPATTQALRFKRRQMLISEEAVHMRYRLSLYKC